jgi:hypothetical protein
MLRLETQVIETRISPNQVFSIALADFAQSAENANLPPAQQLSYGPHLNSLFNLVGYVDHVSIEPGATQDIGMAIARRARWLVVRLANMSALRS